MSDTFKLEILVPSGKVLETDVESATVPTALGEVGILPRHARLTALLGTGVLNFAGAQSGKLVVCGGFLNFTGETLQVLADSVDTSESLQGRQHDADRAGLESALKDVDTQTPDWISNRRKLDRIYAIDRLLGSG